jgi:hypothetical protein
MNALLKKLLRLRSAAYPRDAQRRKTDQQPARNRAAINRQKAATKNFCGDQHEL